MDRFDWLELDKVEAPAHSHEALKQPSDAPSYFRAGEAMYQSGHFRAASDYYRKAVGHDARQYLARVYLIDTLLRAKRIEDADAASEEAIDAFRQVRVFYASRALVLVHQGRFKEARPLSDVSMEGDDTGWYARCVRGEMVLLSQPDERLHAAALFEEAADRTDHPWRAHFIGGWAMLEAQFPALAAGFFAEAARWNPRAPLCWLCLGDTFRSLRLYEQAQFYYQCAAELEPTNELALERQKAVSSLVYGLMRLFRPENVRRRWKKEFEKLVEQQKEPDYEELL